MGTLVSIESEQELLCAVLHNPEELKRVHTVLPDPTWFSVTKHRLIYQACLDVFLSNGDYTAQDIRAALEQSGDLAKAGSGSYVFELYDHGVSRTDMKGRAALIRDYAFRRQLLAACQQSVQEVANTDVPVEKVVSFLESSLALDDGLAAREELKPIGEDLEAYVDDLITGRSESESRYLAAGIPDLDRRLRLHVGDMCIVAGPPSMGKSSFAVGVFLENVRRGKRMIYFALDENKEAIYRRFLANKTSIPAQRILSRDFSEEEKQRLCDAAAPLRVNESIFVISRPGLTVADIRMLCRLVQRQGGLDGIVIDYVQQVRSEGRQDNRTVEMTRISGELKVLAKELGISLVVISQLNRSYDTLGEREFPRATMLRDTGALEQDANIIIFPWVRVEAVKRRYGEDSDKYRELYSEGEVPKAQIVIGKYKEGATGVVKCRWHPERMAFVAESQQAE